MQASPTVRGLVDPGVVVEQVVHTGEAEKAELREGDVLLSWVRGDHKGEVQSPFDLAEIELEEAPLGKVTLEGYRGTEAMRWSLGCTPWQVSVRANLSGELLSGYSKGRELANGGKVPEILQASQQWILLGTQFSGVRAVAIHAWLSFHAAELLRNAKQWKEADNAYQIALQQAANASSEMQGHVLRAWAIAYQQRSDWANAEQYFQQAIATNRTHGSVSFAIAYSLDALGDISTQRGELDKAEQYCRHALGLQEQLAAESLPMGTSLQCLGSIASARGDLAQAEKYYRRAFEVRNKLAPDSLAVAAACTSLGIIARQRGNFSQSDEYERHSFEIRKKLAPESFLVAASLNNLGMIAEARGDLIKAEQYYHQSLDLKQKLVPASLTVVNSLINLGNLEAARGDLDEAEEYYRQALEIQLRLAPGSLDVAALFGNLGKLEQYRGNLEKAEQYYRQTLAIQLKLAPGSLLVARSLTDLGEVAEKRGDLVTAAQYYGQSFGIRQRLAPQSLSTAETLYGLGNIASRSGDFAKAECYYRQALSIREKLAPGSTVHGESLAAVASVLRDQQQLDAAAQFYVQAMSALENQFSRLGGSEQVRSGFGAQHSDIYKSYVELLLSQKQPERALEVLERSRARTLLEMLAAARVDIRTGADPSLLEQERSLQKSLEAKLDRRLRLLARENTEQQVAAISKEIEDEEKQYQDVEEQIRVRSPGYAALTQPQPLAFAEIQRLLDSDTVLIEYFFGEKHSYVFVVTSESLSVHELPERATIERQATLFYEHLTARKQAFSRETAQARQLRIRQSDAASVDAASALGQILLGPLSENSLRKRLVIVSDGALRYVPFAALAVPRTSVRAGASEGKYLPLIVQHEIVELPSASVLAVLRREQANRRAPSKQVFVLADPVFDLNDPRVQHPPGRTARQDGEAIPAAEGDSARMLTRSLRETGWGRDGGLGLPRLPFSRREAQDILAMAPANAGREALDFDANRKLAMSGDLASYRVVHFATHALVDNQHPELSGLVLSLVDEHGSPQEGFLDLQDIYNLDLSADLVVLSACDTALGKEIDGEGMIGLTRGFMYAGAQGVIGTLWKVEDFATAKFMKDFYQSLEQNRMSPVQALRHAQLALWKEKHWSVPYHWSAFTLQGDWR